jgi:hypothetical protein
MFVSVSVRSVTGLLLQSPTFGRLKFPVMVWPALRVITSPHAAEFSAACSVDVSQPEGHTDRVVAHNGAENNTSPPSASIISRRIRHLPVIGHVSCMVKPPRFTLVFASVCTASRALVTRNYLAAVGDS